MAQKPSKPILDYCIWCGLTADQEEITDGYCKTCKSIEESMGKEAFKKLMEFYDGE